MRLAETYQNANLSSAQRRSIRQEASAASHPRPLQERVGHPSCVRRRSESCQTPACGILVLAASTFRGGVGRRPCGKAPTEPTLLQSILLVHPIVMSL